MKRPVWASGVPSDGHTKLIDTAGRAFVVQEYAPLRFELLQLPDPPKLPATSRRGDGSETDRNLRRGSVAANPRRRSR